jgi:hypothetical protein
MKRSSGLLLVSLLSLFLAACGDSETKTDASSNNVENSSVRSDQKPGLTMETASNKAIIKDMGIQIEFDSIETIDSFTHALEFKKSETRTLTPDDGNIFVAVTVKVTNISNESQIVGITTARGVYLVDEKGNMYSTDVSISDGYKLYLEQNGGFDTFVKNKSVHPEESSLRKFIYEINKETYESNEWLFAFEDYKNDEMIYFTK